MTIAINVGGRALSLVVLIIVSVESTWPWTALLILVDLVAAFALTVNLLGTFLVRAEQREVSG